MRYTRDELLDIVSAQMPARRWTHVEGVMATSVSLAERYGADPVKADLAALLHDLAKFWPIERQESVMREHGLNPELLEYDKQLLHAEVAAFVAEQEYGIDDPEVLDAIRYHTSGRVGMTLLDKIVCLADYIEPGRNFSGVDRMRELAEHNLEQALVAGFDSTITFLIEKQKIIFPLTVLARNDIVRRLGYDAK
ncbi:bis(5'-nucleosyl)-tetraphosphatase (symmetrical) YqeK [Paenibacillus motobuensis]|uniref:bis(5'-nucleosyl)-tetraphosphatase (symmetrical) YqeK n=1 Tax=Paenibacillus TaxID=44249 RepID=UPI00203E2F5B|nr:MULTISPECIES: bis(5'-nucleosyl)-tetraphosphatase (symmetrical) YqeK [Paenibacillus]MCM3040622.1 bis(5'-nucleosyl)-tetraphosphatase (symmetrical) YqeK [Paenibacillus lutimineralis]MCM3647726.1 bis(5'-nucleosyl)-tetraphosphatase (symmetrical) YqeK [Paenibacillus motobuensis]